MPSKPVLTDIDKENIQVKLQTLCEQLWISQGYKKTNIKELCQETDISIGTFYSLFSKKEDLFLETAKGIQVRLKDQFLHTVLLGRNKDSLAQAVKNLYREFESKPFLYDVNTPDFIAFVSKLSEQDMEDLRFETIEFFRKICLMVPLHARIDAAKACGTLSALLSTVTTKQTLSARWDSFEIFDYMTDILIAEMFE